MDRDSKVQELSMDIEAREEGLADAIQRQCEGQLPQGVIADVKSIPWLNRGLGGSSGYLVISSNHDTEQLRGEDVEPVHQVPGTVFVVYIPDSVNILDKIWDRCRKPAVKVDLRVFL